MFGYESEGTPGSKVWGMVVIYSETPMGYGNRESLGVVVGGGEKIIYSTLMTHGTHTIFQLKKGEKLKST